MAAVSVEALTNPKAKDLTLELKSDSKTAPAPGDVAAIFDGLKQGVYQ